MPRVGSSRQTTATSSPSSTISSASRWRSPPGQVARVLRLAARPGPRARPPSAPASSPTCSWIRKSPGFCSSSATSPPRTIRPRVGSTRPFAWRSSVLLPAPLRPISATSSPGRSSRSMPRRIAGPSAISCQTPSKRSGRPRRRAGGAGAASASAPVRGRPRAGGRAPPSPTPAPGRSRRARTAARPASRATRAALGRPVEELRRRGVEHDPAALHREHAVGRREAALEPVLGQQHRRPPLLVQPAQQPDELVARDRVELRGGLVQHEQRRLAGDRRRQRDPLQLAARERVGAAVEQVRDAELERRLLDRARDRRRRRSPRCSSGSASSARTPLITTCVSGSWSSVAQLAPGRSARGRARSCPATSSSPRASPPWKCGTSPHAARSSVDLPEPDSPTTSVNEPGSSVERQVGERVLRARSG